MVFFESQVRPRWLGHRAGCGPTTKRLRAQRTPTAPPRPVLLRPASTVAELEFFDEVCEREGFPETLSDEAAAELGGAKPGSSGTIVHTDGQTTAQVQGAGCQEAEEYGIESATLLTLDQPAGPEAPGSKIAQMMAAPNLGFVGASPVPEARLQSPQPVVWKSALGDQVRKHVAKLSRPPCVSTRTWRLTRFGGLTRPGTTAIAHRRRARQRCRRRGVRRAQRGELVANFARWDERSRLS